MNDDAEARRAIRAAELAAYRAGLAASRLNRDRWKADLRAEVEAAEKAMRQSDRSRDPQ